MVEAKPPTFTNESLSYPLGTFVVDPTSGNELTATADSLSAAMSKVNGSPEQSKKDTSAHCIWFAVSKKSIRAAVNFNGERVAKVELEEDELLDAFYVTRHGKCSR